MKTPLLILTSTIHFLLILLLISCVKPEKIRNDISEFKVVDIQMYQHLEKSRILTLNDSIINKLEAVKKVKGPVKGIAYRVILSNGLDSLKLYSYPDSKYIKFENQYYELVNYPLLSEDDFLSLK